ncbi:MAG: EamA family transporter [Bryobacteraceae bacterium]|nr:EamA family transporter [Bryobacteraceae bacterium]
MRLKILILAATVVLLNTAGNFYLGLGMKRAPADMGALLSLLQPWVLLGIALLVIWTLLRMKLLEWADLSFVLPVTAVGYVLNAITGAVFLHEQVSPLRWTGTALIMAGAILTGLTQPAGKDEGK